LIPGNAPDETIQREFIERYGSLLKEAQKESIHLLFGDPSHFIHNTLIGKCWQTKGKKGTLRISSNTGRKRITILGGVNAVNFTFTSLVTEANCDQEMNKVFLDQVRKDYPDGKRVVIILDNAKYNHANSVREHAKELNIELLFLPPYSPNLNLIERIWKLLKSKLKNLFIESFDEFYEMICSQCALFYSNCPEIQRLISQRFQIIKAV
jgi:transposase